MEGEQGPDDIVKLATLRVRHDREQLLNVLIVGHLTAQTRARVSTGPGDMQVGDGCRVLDFKFQEFKISRYRMGGLHEEFRDGVDFRRHR